MNNLIMEAITLIQEQEFKLLWPIEARKYLIRAAGHEGDIPPYAVKKVMWAIKTVQKIERENRAQADLMTRDVQASLEHVAPTRKGHRKNSNKASYDRELRAQMKGKDVGKSQIVTNPNSKKARKQKRLQANRK